MAFTPKTKEFTSKEENTYKFQSVMNSIQAKIWDEGTAPGGGILNTKMMPLMLEHIVVEPAGLDMDDFESWEELTEVTNAALTFLQTGK